MAKIIVKFKDKVLGQYRVDERYYLSIGRRSSNDIVIVNLSTSGYHAEIAPSEAGYVLRDLDSKNGTQLNGKRISSSPLKDGDIITIGKHTLLFRNDGNPLPDLDQKNALNSIVIENPTELVDQTVIIDPRKLSKQAQAKKKPVQPPKQKQPIGVIELLNNRKKILLNRQLIKIGKDRDSDIILQGFLNFLVGDPSATVSKRLDGYYITHVSGFYKTKVNNEKFDGMMKLTEFDIIKIGPFKLQFLYTK